MQVRPRIQAWPPIEVRSRKNGSKLVPFSSSSPIRYCRSAILDRHVRAPRQAPSSRAAPGRFRASHALFAANALNGLRRASKWAPRRSSQPTSGQQIASTAWPITNRIPRITADFHGFACLPPDLEVSRWVVKRRPPGLCLRRRSGGVGMAGLRPSRAPSAGPYGPDRRLTREGAPSSPGKDGIPLARIMRYGARLRRGQC